MMVNCSCTRPVLSIWTFCPWCGKRRRWRERDSRNTKESRVMDQAEQLYASLMVEHHAQPHVRHAEALRGELSNYLSAKAKSEAQTTGEDIAAFLLAKNISGGGRTAVHDIRCPYLGTDNVTYCDCEVQLSHRTLENYRQKLEASFQRIPIAGRQDNPAADWRCKAAIQQLRKRQLLAAVTTKVTRPAWSSTMRDLLENMFCSAQVEPNPQTRAVILHDRAYILDTFRTMVRGSQAGQTLIQKVIWLPNREGLMFGYSWGKTLRDGTEHVFAVRRDSSDPHICLVTAIEDLLIAARAAGWDMTTGYLFRDMHRRGRSDWASAPPMSANKGTTILKQYLRQANIKEDITIHSCRAGGALYRHFQGEDIEDIMYQAYWKSPQTAAHYMQVMRIAGVIGHEPLGEEEYRATNELPLQELYRLVRL